MASIWPVIQIVNGLFNFCFRLFIARLPKKSGNQNYCGAGSVILHRSFGKLNDQQFPKDHCVAQHLPVSVASINYTLLRVTDYTILHVDYISDSVILK
jgi:hypothetical protein